LFVLNWQYPQSPFPLSFKRLIWQQQYAIDACYNTPSTHRYINLPVKIMLNILVISVCLTASGCALLVGKAVYDSGESKRLYNATFDETIRACTSTLESLNFGPFENIRGGIQTQIRAHWSDGTPVTITIEMKALRITEVSIRCGVVGIRDKTVSEIIHDNLTQRLAE